MSSDTLEIVMKKKNDNPDINEHVVNIFFKDLVVENHNKANFATANPDALKYYELIQIQNNSIIRHSAANYYEIHETFENLGKKIIKFEEKMKEIERHTIGNIKNQENKERNERMEVSEVYKTVPEIEIEINQLNIKIEEDQKRIVEYKVPLDKILKSIPEDEDFLNKIAQERKTIVDSLSEEFIIEMTYKDNFIDDYQYELMEIMLGELNKLSFDKVVKEKVEATYKTFAEMSPELKKETMEKAKKSMIIDNFKLTCFNAWKFKNHLLSLERLNIVSKNDIDQIKERLERIRLTAIKKLNDPYYEPFFEKICKLLKVLIFLTVGMKKIGSSRSKLNNLQNDIEKSRIRIAENKGKIDLLNNLKSKINQNLINDVKPSPINEIQEGKEGSNQLHQELKSFMKELKIVKNSVQMNYNSFLKKLGDTVIKPEDLSK